MGSDNCIFCRIAAGEIPSDTVYEDEDFRIILDLNPAHPGHSLLIPKRHFDDVFDMDEATAAKVLPLAKKAGKAVMKATGAAGLNILQNNGEAAGQTVRHFHVHLIPRTENDGSMLLWEPGTSVREEQQKIAASIVKALEQQD